jgi:hypothetical protein
VGSAGETLFNKEESDILLHRPIKPETLLWSKVFVLVQVCFYLSFAINLVGLFVGLSSSDSNGLFPFIHLISSMEEALFSAACVVLVYQLCLRWFGRQRLENMMTAMQVLVMAAITIGSQIIPRLLIANVLQTHGKIARPPWLALIPPGWFAGLDDAIAGSHAKFSWLLASIGLVVTSLSLWLAFGKLATSYEGGLQTLSESAAPRPGRRPQLRLLTWLAQQSPVKWWLKGSVEQVAFVLTAAYLLRDREVKLRVFPAITSVLMMPVIMLFSNYGLHQPHRVANLPDPVQATNSFLVPMAICFGGAFLGSMVMMGLNLLTFSQQWKASEVFRIAPIRGPWPIQRGAMVAVNVLLVLPMVVLLSAFAVFTRGVSSLPLLLPGLLPVPVYSRIPELLQGTVPLSRAGEEAKSAGRGCFFIFSQFFAFIVAGIALGCNSMGWLYYMLVVEACGVAGFCFAVKGRLESAPWGWVD